MNDQPSHSAILLCNIAKPIHLLNTRLNSFHFGCWTCLHHLGILKPIPDRPAEQSWFGLGSDGLRDDFVRIWIQGDSPLKIYHHGKVLSQIAWSLVICDRQDALYILFSIEIEGCIQYSDCISWYCLYSFGFSSRLDDVDDWMFCPLWHPTICYELSTHLRRRQNMCGWSDDSSEWLDWVIGVYWRP